LADYSHLTECLYNIIINAFESIPNDKPGYVNVISYCEYSWFIIKIQDTGCGIDKKALSKIFDPFYTKKNTAKNWGVGLSYAKQIINGHMGHIDVSSNIDEGSSFCIFIPIYKLNN
ncbi:MAG: HAMP domain-containing sensor histidine kinase, partial [Clostridium sp.]|nr:HAMP domain-containing sensor histidine kinase [Clostridium sp.]